MTIYKVNNQEKNVDKEILAKKLLAESLPEVEEAPHPVVTVQRRTASKTWLNIFLILVALLVLAAGITGGVLLYRRLSHKIYKGKCGFRPDVTLPDNGAYALSQNSVMNVEQTDLLSTKPQQVNRKHHKHHHRRPTKPVDLSEDVQVIDEKIEKIHMPSFRDFRDTMILHDFEKNYSCIVDYEEKACYVMKLDRKQVAPPRDWIDLIQKFATGYYMPRAEVLRRKYRVILPALKDISMYGRYIENECQYYHTYSMTKITGDHFIAKRGTGAGMSFKLLYSYYEPAHGGNYINMELFK